MRTPRWPCQRGGGGAQGDQLRQEALALLKACPDIRFTGNIEARDIPYNQADVVVAKWFTSNMILKLYEGVAMALMDKIKGVFMTDRKAGSHGPQ